MAELPAWSGVVGDSLTSAATAYLKAINDQPFEKEELEKAKLDNAHIRSQMELEKAHALYYGRPQTGTVRPTRVGNQLVWVDENGAKVVFEGPEKKEDELEILRRGARIAMEKRMGKEYGLEVPIPVSEWKAEDFNRPFVAPLRDFAGIGKSGIVVTPGGVGAEARPRADIYAGAQPPAGQSPVAPTPKTPAPGPASSPVTPPAVTPRSAQPPKPVSPAEPSSVTGEATPELVALHEKRWRSMTKDEADKQFEVLRKDPKIKPGDLASALEAYHKVHGVWPAGFEVQDVPAPGATPPPAKPAGSTTPTPLIPPKTPGRRELAPVAPPPPPPDWGRNRTTPLNNEQLAQVASDAYKLDLQYRQAQAQELEVERKNREEDTKNELRALGGDPTPEIKEVTLKLNAAGKVNGKDFTRLMPDEQKLVIDTKNLPKLRKEEQSWKKLAQKSMDEVNALQTSQDLVTMILPLIKNSTVGFAGRMDQVGVWMRSLWARNRFYKDAEANLKKTPEGQALLDKLGQGAIDARVASDIESNDPAVRESQRHIATRARLQTLSSVLMYAHALAQKRITGGSTRGLIKPDMDEAHKLFDPDLFFTAPEQLMANLQELQGVIQGARARVEDDVRSYHFTPMIGVKGRLNWKYQPGEVDEEAPAAAPEVIAPTALERLQGAGKKP